MTHDIGSLYGFRVAQDTRDPDLWCVSLPHECDRWDIAGCNYKGVTHDQAVTALQRFITEAQQALGALRDQQEWHPE